MRNKVIIHFAPLELYPPIQNLLSELAKKGAKNLYVISTRAKTDPIFTLESEAIKIVRFGYSGMKTNSLIRLLNYAYFYIAGLGLLLYRWPNRILYYETLSSLPVYLFKRFFNRACEVLIHYHEYTSPQEYAEGMKLSEAFHTREKWLYPRSKWISHTNEFRMKLFKQDVAPVEIPQAHILPNYPPRNWASDPKTNFDRRVKIIYVGALSLDTMFTREFARWIIDHNGNVTWDIYSSNYTEDARNFLVGLNSPYIQFHEGISYNQLPSVLRNYHIGVILYKGHIPNYIYNAPNKLFEYLACGLDVWFPQQMIGCSPYVRTDECPKILPLDFERLHNMDLVPVTARSGKIISPEYFCEETLRPLLIEFLQ